MDVVVKRINLLVWDFAYFRVFVLGIAIIIWVVPLPSNSHHDYSIFRLGDPELNLYLPRLHPGRGDNPTYSLRNDGWKMKFPVIKNFSGDLLI